MSINSSFQFVGENRNILNDYIIKDVQNGRTVYKCSMCGKFNAQNSNIRNHVESVHFPNLFTYTCTYCGKQYNAKNSLNVHISTTHRREKYGYENGPV